MAYDPWSELAEKRAQQDELARQAEAARKAGQAQEAAALNAEWGQASAGLPVPGEVGGRLDDLPSLAPDTRLQDQVAQDMAAEESAVQAGLAPRAYEGPQGDSQDAMAMADTYGRRADDIFGLSGQRQTFRYRDPMHEPVQEFATRMRGGLEAQTKGQKGVLAAERVGAMDQRDALERYERELGTEMNVRKAAANVQLEQEADAIEGIRQKQQATAEAIKQFTAMPKFSTAWADRDAGSRAAIVMSSIADVFMTLGSGLMQVGGAGPGIPPHFVKDLLSREQQAYETKRAAAAQNLDALNSDEAAAIRAYDQVRSLGQSKRESDLLQDQTRLGVLEAEFKRLLAQNKVQVLTESQKELFGQIEQQKAQNDLELTQLQMAHPKYKTASASPFTPEQKKMLGVAFKDALDKQGNLQKAWLDRQKDEGKIDPKQLNEYAARRQGYEEVLSMSSRLRERWQGKIPWNATGHWIIPQDEDLANLTKESRVFLADVGRVLGKQLRIDTGAVISADEELKMALQYAGNFRTPDEVWEGISALETKLQDGVEFIDRGFANEVVQQYNRNAQAVTPGGRAGVKARSTQQGYGQGFTAE